jgi:formiminoglutamate deiminase
MYDVAARLDPDSYRRLARAAYAEMALAGFTAIGEFHYLHHAPGGAPYADPNQMGLSLMEAAREAGVRLTLLDACYLEGGFGARLAGPQLRFGDGSSERWIDRVGRLAPTEQTVLGAAVHSVRAVPPEAVVAVAGYAKSRGWPLHAHVSEQRRENEDCQAQRGTTPLVVLAGAGAVGPSFTAVHGTHLTGADVGVLASEGGGCCACPTTERDLGDGIGPFAALQRAGVALSVGTDSHAVVDGFEEARGIELGARLADERRGLLRTSTLLEAATVNGMAALGWDSGALAPGRLADFVTIRLDSPRTAGCDPGLAATAVFAASAPDVCDVVVGGRPVVRDGVHLTVPDVPMELAAAIGALLS